MSTTELELGDPGMTKDIVAIIEAVGNSWPALMVLVIIVIFLLLWKFGADLIALLKENNDKAQHVIDSIQTNHGSKNMGHAVDRLHEQLLAVQETLANHGTEIAAVNSRLDDHISTTTQNVVVDLRQGS